MSLHEVQIFLFILKKIAISTILFRNRRRFIIAYVFI